MALSYRQHPDLSMTIRWKDIGMCRGSVLLARQKTAGGQSPEHQGRDLIIRNDGRIGYEAVIPAGVSVGNGTAIGTSTATAEDAPVYF